MSGIPVVISSHGGIPVRQVTSGAPVMTVATNGFGIPIVLSNRGLPFVVEGLTPAPSWSVQPSISGTPQVGQTLTGSDGTIANGTVTLRQWLNAADNSVLGTGATFALQEEHEGLNIKFKVTAVGTGGSAAATSTQVGPVTEAATGGTFTGVPSITGTRGGTLTAVDAPFTGTDTLSRSWVYDDGTIVGSGTTLSDTQPLRSIELINTLTTSGETVSAYRGVAADAPLLQTNFAAAADGTLLRNISPWTHFGTGTYQDSLKVYGGLVRKTSTYPGEGGTGGRITTITPTSYIVDVVFNMVLTELRPLLGIGGKTVTIRRASMVIAGTSVNYTAISAGLHTARFIVDDVAKTITAYVDDILVPFSGGSVAYTGSLTTNFDFQLSTDTLQPIGSDLYGDVKVVDLAKIQVGSIAFQPVGIDQSKIVASGFNRVSGSSTSEWRLERQSGEMVKDWAATTQTGTTWAIDYTIPVGTLENERLVLKVRNIGGTASIGEALSPLVPVKNNQKMRIGMNAVGSGTIGGANPYRDLAKTAQVTLQPTFFGVSARSRVGGPGEVPGPWGSWGEPYNPALTYPGPTSGQQRFRVMHQGIEYEVISTVEGNIPINTPPNPAAVGPYWKPTDSGLALHSLIYDAATGLIVKHPDDPNREVQFELQWTHPVGVFPFTIAGKSAPGAILKFSLRPNITLTSPVDANGDFTLTVTDDTDGQSTTIIVDRDGAVVPQLNLIPSYETDTGLVSDKYIDDMTVFCEAPRNMSGTFTNQNITRYSISSLAERLKPAQVGWKGEACWEFEVELAKKLGKPMYINTKYFDPDSYKQGWAEFLAADEDFVEDVYVEDSNENWQAGNAAFNQGDRLIADAAALGISKEQLHSRKTRQTIEIFKTAFAGQEHRVKGVMAWQTFTSVSMWETMLNFEDCYQVISEISTAPYHSTGLMRWSGGSVNASTAVKNAVAANDYPAFVTAMRADMTAAIAVAVAGVKPIWDWIPIYCVSKGLPKDAITIGSYETNHHVEVLGSWTDLARAKTFWNTFKASSDMSDMTTLYIDSMAASCPHRMRLFDYCGISGRTAGRLSTDGSGWELMRKTGDLAAHPMSSVIERAAHYNAL